MSDLQDLIHRNAQLAYEQGARNERERIIQLLQALPQEFNRKDEVERLVAVAIRGIKSEDF